MMSKKYLTMEPEYWELLNAMEDEGFTFSAALLLLFGDDVVRLDILSEDATERLAEYHADKLSIERAQDSISQGMLRAVAGVSGRMAEIKVEQELRTWQNENWPSWGQPSN